MRFLEVVKRSVIFRDAEQNVHSLQSFEAAFDRSALVRARSTTAGG